MTDNNGSADAGNPAAAGGEGTSAPWYAGIEDAGLRGFAESKQFKDPAAVLSSYQNLERHMGVPADRLLKLPDKADAPEWKEIRARVGFSVPEKWEDYGLQNIEGAHPEYAANAAKWAHELGIPKDMLTKLAEKQGAWVAELEKAEVEAIKAKEAADMQALRAEWGQRYDGSVEMARRAANDLAPKVGLDADALQQVEAALGTAKFLKLFSHFGSVASGEAAVHGESSGMGFLSPEGAQHQINMLKSDLEFGKKLINGDVAARQKWDSLNRIAAGSNPQA